MLIYIITHQYAPHSKYINELKMDIDWNKKRTPYILGILAGLPPCIFEILIYTQCFTYTLSYGFLSGLLTILSFSTGTFLGLFPLAIISEYTDKQGYGEAANHSKVSIIMIILIIVFNFIIMFLSIIQIDIFAI